MAHGDDQPRRHRAITEASEEPGYVEHRGQQLYYVLHPALGAPRAAVLLAGPFASERPHRYIPWVRWARALALSGFAALRFDYRGVGESTGRFEDMGFLDWQDDLCAAARLLGQRAPDVPLVLHGLGLGALLATRAFDGGVGDALLSWLAPVSGRALLSEQLKLRLANDMVLRPPERRGRDEYLAAIEAGETVEVEGYGWTRRLLEHADAFSITPDAPSDPRRPRHAPALDALATHVFGGVGPNPARDRSGGKAMRLVNPDLSVVFEQNLAWLRDLAAARSAS